MDFSGVSWADVGRVLAGLVPVVTIVAGAARGQGAARSRLTHDLELLDKIPAGTEARKTFEDYLAGQVKRFSEFETTASRDVTGAVTGLILVLALFAGTVFLVTDDGWWAWVRWSIAAVTFAFGVAGLAVVYESAQRRPRDEKDKGDKNKGV